MLLEFPSHEVMSVLLSASKSGNVKAIVHALSSLLRVTSAQLMKAEELPGLISILTDVVAVNPDEALQLKATQLSFSLFNATSLNDFAVSAVATKALRFLVSLRSKHAASLGVRQVASSGLRLLLSAVAEAALRSVLTRDSEPISTTTAATRPERDDDESVRKKESAEGKQPHHEEAQEEQEYLLRTRMIG
eukprot:GHVU01026573.1.p1 GENE.GHVU01026573.1~~GHVU01026573.1.p1  ORF type:complete len:191 (-),score=25.95 GHVU01026573.1:752-1324(-)